MSRDLFEEYGVKPPGAASQPAAAGPRDLFAEFGVEPPKGPTSQDMLAQNAKDMPWHEVLAANAGRGLDKAAGALKQMTVGTGAVLAGGIPDALGGQKVRDYLQSELVGLDKQMREGERLSKPMDEQRPVLSAIGQALPMMASPAVRVLGGAGALPAMGNAAISAALPAALMTYGDAGERAKAAGMAGAAGGATAGLMNLASKIVAPKVAPQVQNIMNDGVTPTPGQILGGNWAKAEEKLTSVPILGDAVAGARQRANEQFNVAAINRGLSSIGEKVDKAGREGVEQAGDKISAAYNALLPKLTVKIDQPFAQDMQKLAGMAQNLPEAQAKQFNQIMGQNIANRFSPNGGMAGETLKEAESQLGYFVRNYRSSNNPDQRMLGDALLDAQTALRDLVARSNPQHAKELRDINAAFANQVRIENAAGRLGSREGIFTPEALQSAVKAGDKSARKNAFAKGNALMQDFSETGVNVLGRTVPDSGTAGRVANMGMLAAALAGAPGALIGAAGGSALYSPAGQKALATLLTKRPQSMMMLGNKMEDLAPLLAQMTGASAANAN